MVKMLAGTMSERCAPQDGDYIKDGLIYCGKCNTPTEYRMIFPSNAKVNATQSRKVLQ